MIKWTKKFETGSAKLDQQHRLLIDNINLLKDLLDTPSLSKQEEEFSVFLVDYLGAYANLHFTGEERCMEAYRCPVHALNQQEHQRFREYIQDYRRRRESEGFKVELLRNLHRFMRAWIVEHILKIDTQLKPCIKRQQAAA
jgi:hemerythrin